MNDNGRAQAPAGKPRRVVVLAYPLVDLLDVAGPTEVFGLANFLAAGMAGASAHHYRLEVIATGDQLQLPTAFGLALTAQRLLSDLSDEEIGEIDTLLIPAGPPEAGPMHDPALHHWLREAAPRIRRVGSVCAGALVLAAAGLLDGRRATSHWQVCGLLAREYPRVTVEPDAIYVKDGNIYSSAGSTAGIDLALAMLEEDLGRETTLEVARNLIMFARRPGGQSQFTPLLQLQNGGPTPLRSLQDWILDHLREDLSIQRLAEQVHMSPRHFSRVFTQEVGWTPARFVERLRVDAARSLLEETHADLERVARHCGFGSADSMRRAFLRVVRVPPQDYRSRFQRPA